MFNLAIPFLITAFLAMYPSFAAAQETQIFIMSTQNGSKLMNQCSRPTPSDIAGYWLITSKDVSELEELLEPFLGAKPVRAFSLPLTEFHRQYIGFKKGGKSYIYGNFYKYSSWLKSEADSPVTVCDGGPAFWGIVYSLEDKSFSDLKFNGHL